MKWLKGLSVATGALVVLLLTLYGYLLERPGHPDPGATGPVPHFNHVFLIVMENHSLNAMSTQEAPYIHHLIQVDGYDSAYFGVTHVSLPNYVALLSGSTHNTHSDNPNQRFYGPTLASQLTRHHLTWQAVMESLPYTGYTGNWFPEKPGTHSVLVPKNALYAKKHDPFMLFPSIVKHDARHVVPLRVLSQELHRGTVPRFVWITPNLCSDMHGQPTGSLACPSNRPQSLIRMGNQFLAQLVPQITHSSAFTGHSVIFITWDEADMPSHEWNVAAWKQWLMGGPGAPKMWGVPVGGGSVPLITIIPGRIQPPHTAIWADHYNLLKTIEAGFGLPYLGHAASPSASLLTPLLRAR